MSGFSIYDEIRSIRHRIIRQSALYDRFARNRNIWRINLVKNSACNDNSSLNMTVCGNSEHLLAGFKALNGNIRRPSQYKVQSLNLNFKFSRLKLLNVGLYFLLAQAIEETNIWFLSPLCFCCCCCWLYQNLKSVFCNFTQSCSRVMTVKRLSWKKTDLRLRWHERALAL